jgi:saccharopine dehydrogenase-like NADP-dependent oxidoreductase
MSTSVIVLGAGLVGRVMAADLAADADLAVTIADVRPENLRQAQALAERLGRRISTQQADLSDQGVLARTIAPHAMVCGALPSHIAFGALRTIIEARKNFADISFMPEDPLALDAPARKAGVTAVVDCGVAPGMSHICAARGAALLDEPREIEIYVGGLPRERRWPFEYKAGFSPADVIEEYTRPTRLVEHGKVVVREALSEPELMNFDGLGTLEAFNTDGLRSLANTYRDRVPFMKEKTLRYPGHIELMRVLRAMGLFSQTPITVPGGAVKPLDVVSSLMFPMWQYQPGEEDLTVMRIIARGRQGGVETEHVWDLLDFFDKPSGCTSMSRTTAFPCAIMAREIIRGTYRAPGGGGVVVPERLGEDAALFDRLMAGLTQRGVVYRHSRRTPAARS